MMKYIKIIYIYSIFWSLLNIIHDSVYKYINISIGVVLLHRYILSFIVGLILLLFIPRKNSVISWFKLQTIIILGLTKALSTFCALLCGLIQLSQESLGNTTIIFYSITYFDYVFGRFFKLPHEYQVNKFIILGLISVYYIYNSSVDSYIYGYLSSIFFSCSNNIFLIMGQLDLNMTKSSILIMDYFIFTLTMIILVLIYFGSKISWNWPISILSLLGTIINILLYWLFFYGEYSPSSEMAFFDISLGTLFDKIYFNIYPEPVTILLIIQFFLS